MRAPARAIFAISCLSALPAPGAAQDYVIGDLPILGGDFSGAGLAGWDRRPAPGVSLEAVNGAAGFRGAGAGPSLLSRTMRRLPDGTYSISADFAVSGGGAAEFYAVDGAGDTLSRAVPASADLRTLSLPGIRVAGGVLAVGVRYSGSATASAADVDNVRLRRTARPDSTGRLLFAGVTPYGGLDKAFTGIDGKTRYPDFPALAKDAGANAMRTFYEASDSGKAYWPYAAEAARLGLRNVCTFLPTHDHPSFAASLDAVLSQARAAAEGMLRRGPAPDLILLGNEINTDPWELTSFAGRNYASDTAYARRLALTLKAAADGLRAGGYRGDIGTHLDRPWTALFTDLIADGFTDLQVAAFSCYPRYIDDSATVETQVGRMHPAAGLGLKVLIVETAAPYAPKDPTQDFDSALVAEVSPAGQVHHLRRMCDLALAIPDGKGIGVLTWGSDLAEGIHEWSKVTWNRAQVTAQLQALPSLYVFGEYAAPSGAIGVREVPPGRDNPGPSPLSGARAISGAGAFPFVIRGSHIFFLDGRKIPGRDGGPRASR